MSARRLIPGVSVALAAGLLAGACGSSAASLEQADTTPDSTESAPTSTETTLSDAPSIDETDPAALLVDFAGAWDAGDWEAAASLATPNVIEVAQEWREDGADAAESLALALESGCLDVFDDGTTCEFVYGGPDGPGLIFNATVGTSDGGLKVTDLVFGGDAG